MNLLIKLVHVCGFVESDYVWYYLHATVYVCTCMCACMRGQARVCENVFVCAYVCGVFVHVSVCVHAFMCV